MYYRKTANGKHDMNLLYDINKLKLIKVLRIVPVKRKFEFFDLIIG